MKVLWAAAAIGLTLMGPLGPAFAQYGGGPDYGYRERDRDRGRERDRDRDDGYRDRGGRDRDRGREVGFSERDYLRCNPDVRQAVASGRIESGAAHYRTFGRRENRQLSC